MGPGAITSSQAIKIEAKAGAHAELSPLARCGRMSRIHVERASMERAFPWRERGSVPWERSPGPSPPLPSSLAALAGGIRQHLWPQLKVSKGRCRSWHHLDSFIWGFDPFLECKLKQRKNIWGQILLLGTWAPVLLAPASRGAARDALLALVAAHGGERFGILGSVSQRA